MAQWQVARENHIPCVRPRRPRGRAPTVLAALLVRQVPGRAAAAACVLPRVRLDRVHEPSARARPEADRLLERRRGVRNPRAAAGTPGRGRSQQARAPPVPGVERDAGQVVSIGTVGPLICAKSTFTNVASSLISSIMPCILLTSEVAPSPRSSLLLAPQIDLRRPFPLQRVAAAPYRQYRRVVAQRTADLLGPVPMISQPRVDLETFDRSEASSSSTSATLGDLVSGPRRSC